MYGAIFGPDTGWAWGLSIVSLVILIRICLIPLFVKQIKSTRAMQTLQPEMKKIQERYKSDKQRQSEEMMKLYKETGTNPFSSCLPILVQSPFFFALYHVLTYISQGKKVGVITDQNLVDSACQAHIFGAPIAAKFTDSADKLASLSATLVDVRIVTVIMIVLMSLSQFVTQRQLMTKNVDLTVKTPFMQQQKMLMYVFPVMFAVFGINFPVGVLVYWLTTNVWTMGQQMYVIRNNPTPGSKAQASYLERLHKRVTQHGRTRGRGQKAIVKAIVAKGRDRNEAERKFINGLNKAGMAAQADGTVVKGQAEAAVEAEDGTTTTTGGAPKRQQPKRQSKSQRQSGTAAGGAKAAGEPEPKTSLIKSDDPQDAKPAAKPAGGANKPGTGTRSKAQSGQRKGPQRPKSPSKK